MRVIGVMSGTSYDAVDVAAADLELRDDAVMLHPLGAASVPYADEVRSRIAAGLPPAQASYEQVCRLDTELGQVFADAATQGMRELCGGRADLVVSHGQTVYHWVDESGRAQGTLQLGQPAWIAERTGLPVVSDLRSRDVARGGNGAPLASIFDVLLLGGTGGPRAALNLGGIANLTVVGGSAGALAYDVGPANALVDAATTELCGEPFDTDGRRAARGNVHEGLLATLLDEPYYAALPPKSTGKELFHWGYVRDRLSAFGSIDVDDLVATLTELTARIAADELGRWGVLEVFASGGGVRNARLMQRLAELAGRGCTLRTIDELGVGADEKEAYAFALLGFLTMHGLAGTIPSCTGASGPSVLGSITPGALPLRLPTAVAVCPTRLSIS